jgi:hypothetical protein
MIETVTEKRGRWKPERIPRMRNARVEPLNRGGGEVFRQGWQRFPLSPALSPGETGRQSQSYPVIPAVGSFTVLGQAGGLKWGWRRDFGRPGAWTKETGMGRGEPRGDGISRHRPEIKKIKTQRNSGGPPAVAVTTPNGFNPLAPQNSPRRGGGFWLWLANPALHLV